MEKFPLAVEIEINSHCNLACPYCPNSKFERIEKGHMDESLYLEILAQLKSFHFKGRISYHFYNEPTLSPNLERYLRLAKEHLPECRTELFTNATLLDKNKFEELSNSGMDKFTVTKHVQADSLEIDATVESLREDVREKIKMGSYKQLVLSNRGGSVNVNYKVRVPPLKIPCFIPKCVLIVTVKGNVVPCFEDFFQKNVMGNVRENHILEIWNSEKYVNFRERLKKGARSEIDVCKSCNNALMVS